MSIKDKLDYLQDTKQAIKTAIQGKGQAVADTDTFRSYADKINAITTGGGGETDETLKELVEGTLTEFNDVAGSISYIRQYAFAGQSKLTNAILPNVRNVGSYAFSGTSALQGLDLPNVETAQSYAFRNAGGGGTLNVPNLVGNIYNGHICTGCGFEIINMPKLTWIVSNMFQSCSNLKSVNLPLAHTAYDFAFAGCILLEQIELPALSYTANSVFARCSALRSVSLPVCTNIGSSAFASCSSLQTISFPACTSIGTAAFRGCSKLSAIYLQQQATLGTTVFNSTPMSLSSYLGYFGSIYVLEEDLSWYQTATNWVAYSSRITTFTPVE